MADYRGLNPDDHIAIIGMAGRFPGAPDLETYWRNLHGGVESVKTLTADDLQAAGIDAAKLDDPRYVPAAAVVDGYDRFAADFFGYAPREAEVIDPQQRLFLEGAWHALENAGYDGAAYEGLVGVYAAAGTNSYQINLYTQPGIVQSVGPFALVVGNSNDYLSTRVSFKLDLEGPSMSVQTACSSSLVAVHLACESLRNGECEMALAGGATVGATEGYSYVEGGVFAPDGHCRPFDAKAAGTVFGSGLGVVVLKRLGDALADGDTVRAVIRGSAVNNDGATRVGFTAPGLGGQKRVIAEALSVAEVEADTLSYVEAHGTGTSLGDPIEVTALTQAFRQHTAKQGFCALGSVKANIGHTEAAAGIAGLIKVVLAFEHQQLPPSLNFEHPNPQIDFANSPFFVNQTLADWPRNAAPRRAALSSFGVGGTNAHAIIEEAPPTTPAAASRPQQLLLLSARTPTALEAATENLAAHLRAHPQRSLADTAYTLQVGRRAFTHRRMVVSPDTTDAATALAGRVPGRVITASRRQAAAGTVFLFPGQGAQHIGMAAGLRAAEPAFRDPFERCATLLRPHLGFDLGALLAGELGDDAEAAARLQQTAVAQPALFAVEYSLAQMWMAWGVVPRAMLGHSIGEYVAACLAGVFSLEDALSLVAARGALMQGLPAGAMLAVPLPAAEVDARIADDVALADLALAATNGPQRSVVSGPEAAIATLADRFGEEGVACRPLHTSHAFHSPMMEPILQPYLERVRSVARQPPQRPWISNGSGTWIRAEEATDPAYWARHLRGTVRFAEGLETLFAAHGDAAFLEVGPGRTLGTLSRQHPERPADLQVISSLPHPKEGGDDQVAVLSALGRLWCAGVEIDWPGFYGAERRQRVPLPGYPFERQRYWIDARSVPDTPQIRGREALSEWFYAPLWKPSADLPPFDQASAPQRWLLFLAGDELGLALADHLRALRRQVVTVVIGEGFDECDANAYALDPADRAAYDQLFAALAAADNLPDVIVHTWGLAPVDGPEAALAYGFWSLLYLGQALGSAHLAVTEEDPGVRLLVVGSEVQAVESSDVIVPAKAAALGPCRVLPREYPGLRVAVIDVVPEAIRTAWLVRPLLAEAMAIQTGAIKADVSETGAVIAHRSGLRWVAGLERVPIDGVSEDDLPFREHGVYLITGGFGGLGMTFARMLAERYQARLVLLGRSSLPPREEWEAQLVAAPTSRASQRIRQVQALEAAGGAVRVATADVADAAAMRIVIEETRHHFGMLNGIIHAAGVAGGGLAQGKTRQAAEAVLRPKVHGILALATALANDPLDLLILCSSTISFLGSLGQVDYCAANQVLDAYARARAGYRTRTVSIAWDGWEEVGMAVAAGLFSPGGKEETGRALAHPLLGHCLEEGAGLEEGADLEEGAGLEEGAEIEEGEAQRVYHSTLSAAQHWVLDEHRILGRGALPGTALLEMARAAFEDHAGPGPVTLRDVFFFTPVMVADNEETAVRLVLEPTGEAATFRIESRSPAGWMEHARGTLARPSAPVPTRRDLAGVGADWKVEHAPQLVPKETGKAFVSWGPRWQSLQEVRLGEGEGLGTLALPTAFADDLEAFALHPALLDVATGIGAALVPDGLFLPLSYHRLHVWDALPARFHSHVVQRGKGDGETATFDITLVDESGMPRVEIEGFTLKRVKMDALEGAGAAAEVVPGTSQEAVPGISRGASHEAVGIRPEEGVEALLRILSRSRLPVVAVSPFDLPTRLAHEATLSDLVQPEAGPPLTVHARPDLGTPFEAPRNELETKLAAIWGEQLGIEAVGIHDNFFDLGGDSLRGVQVVARSQRAGITISPEQLFEHQTIAALAEVATLGTQEPAPTPASAPAASDGEKKDFSQSGLAPDQLEKALAQLRGSEG